jgi:predicted RNase H-like nuclease
MMSSTTNRGGPDLGYSIVAGVTPCAPGWLVASAKVHAANFAPEYPRVYTSFADLLDERPPFSVIAVNAPIGYVENASIGGRTCDRMARRLLRSRGSTVHNAPTRGVIEENEVITGNNLDAVSSILLARYREVAAEMAPFRQRTVYEAHPELSFYQLNEDKPLRWSKKYEAGREERRVLLGKRIHGAGLILNAELEGVASAHLLDAAAMLWTARRIFARAATRLPIDPEWDGQGLRMELVL